MKKEKNISIKNYLVVLFVSIVIIVVALYARAFYINYRESKSVSSYFVLKKVNKITVDDIKYTLSEYRDAILYVGYTGSSPVYASEKKIYKELEKNNLLDILLYLDVTNLVNNNEYIEILKKEFKELAADIKEAPLIIIIKDGKAIEVLNSELEKIDYKLLRKIIKRNEIE